MTSTKEDKATKASKPRKPPVEGAAAAMLSLKALALMPLHMLAEGQNKSVPSVVRELTGLSKARISKGNLDAIRPSTQKKIQEHQVRWLEAHVTDSEALVYARSQISTAPTTRSGNYAFLAGWIHQLELLPHIPLPISRSVSMAIDELLEALLVACANNDLAAFKQTLLCHIEHHWAPRRVGDDPAAEFVTESELAEARALEDWSQTASFTKRLVDALYLDWISTLDAEWSSHYFVGRQRSPLFPLVMARAQKGLLEGRMPRSRKNLFYRPSRRLLEFLYALVFYMRYKKWPTKPPSPMKLSNILFRPGEDEVLGNSVVSSYFDGSTKLTLDLVCEHWGQMYHHFLPESPEDQRLPSPLPMIMLALQWQTLLVLDKGKSILLLNLEGYNLMWHHRRQQWEAQQSRREKLSSAASHKTGDPIEWPAWMLN